jgi:hypothetical protein
VVGQVLSLKLRGVVISHSFAFSASRRLKFSYKSILPCAAFPSTLVSTLELSPPLTVLLLLRVGGLSCLNTRALLTVHVATGIRKLSKLMQPLAEDRRNCLAQSTLQIAQFDSNGRIHCACFMFLDVISHKVILRLP